jgi:ornithine decarboxylase
LPRTDRAGDLLRAARSLSLDVRGLSFHLGSQCEDPDAFGPVLESVRRIYDADRKGGGDLDTLDIGGGPPAPYREPAEIASLPDYLSVVKGHLDAHFGDLPLRVLAEPGRALVADAVTAIVRVVGRSVRGGVPWYFIDDGIYGTFSDRDADRCPYPVLAEAAGGRPLAACVLAGQTCDSLDLVWEGRHLPADLEVGELLLVPSVGAYTHVSATTFNGYEPPAVVAVDDNTGP